MSDLKMESDEQQDLAEIMNTIKDLATQRKILDAQISKEIKAANWIWKAIYKSRDLTEIPQHLIDPNNGDLYVQIQDDTISWNSSNEKTIKDNS